MKTRNDGLHVIERQRINGFNEYFIWFGDECLGVFESRRRALRQYRRIGRKLEAGIEVKTETIIANHA